MKLAGALILVLAATAAAQDNSQFDLSTNDGVNAAREAISGKKLHDRSKRCIRRDPSLPGIVVVGGFAFDRGCRIEGVFVKSTYVAADDKGLSRNALEALGWKAANQQQREALARAWVAEGLLAFMTVLSDKHEDFGSRSFQPPLAVTKDDGQVVVTLWVRPPSGRVRGPLYQLREYKFTKEADIAGNTTVDSFTANRD